MSTTTTVILTAPADLGTGEDVMQVTFPETGFLVDDEGYLHVTRRGLGNAATFRPGEYRFAVLGDIRRNAGAGGRIEVDQ